MIPADDRLITGSLMHTILQFLKSTVIGGLLVLAPLGILGVIVVEAVQIGIRVVMPLIEMLPVKSVGGVSLAVMAAVVAIILLCFVAGLLAQMTLTQRLIKSIEGMILSSIPGYALMKNVGENLLGVQGKEGRKTVLIRLEHSSLIGFWMEQLPDGRVAVFVPNVPNAMTGALHLVAPERLEWLPVPIGNTLDCLNRLGVGLNREWKAPIPLGEARETLAEPQQLQESVENSSSTA
jgi:uncharacterized membrane protein